MADQPLRDLLSGAGARFDEVRGIALALDYGAASAEYAAALRQAGLYAASNRGLIEIRGRDRAAWLHNLTTNAVKTLRPGEGNYTFAVNVKGRILMDFNVLVLGDAIWLDIDRRLAAKALAHFDRYTITEDVQCLDRSAEFARIGLLGPQAVEIADALGAAHAKAMPSLASTPVPLVGKHRLLVRHDFAGLFGIEFYAEVADAVTCWDRLLEIGRPVGLRPVGWNTVNTLRIESGIPWYGVDIDEDVLPAETDQIERAVSYVKGCYLGQEVVERMRSRGAVANKLVGLVFTAGQEPEAPARESPVLPSATPGLVQPPAVLKANDVTVGRVTSVCFSPAVNAWIGLGYVRSSHAGSGLKLDVAGGRQVEATVVALPFR